MNNSIYKKPKYSAHRLKLVASDSAVLATLLAANLRSQFNAYGFDSIHGFVLLEGTTPAVTLIPHELVEYVDNNGTAQQILVQRGDSIGPLSSGDSFSFDTPGGGRWFIRTTKSGTLTNGEIYVAGGVFNG